MYRSAVLVLYTIPFLLAIELKEGSINYGGYPTSFRKYPYMVSIRYGGTHICGGSVIRPSTILTAGHCVYNLNIHRLTVRAGTDFRLSGGVIEGAKSSRVHPKFCRITLTYDIGFLYLNETLPISDTLRPIPLYREPLLSGWHVVAIGWGTLYEGGRLSNILRSVILPVLSRENCLQVYGSKITSSMFCAGVMDGSRDTCQGDSGGPIVLNGKLAGITSQGNGCGRPGFPGVYTKIPLLVDWIDEYA